MLTDCENTPPVGASAPVLAPGHTYATITDKISSIVLLQKTRRGWWFGFAIAFTLFMILNMAIGYLLMIGVGIWGINIPIGWGFAIVNFVWWIGIGHAGTLISAFLLLMRQAWRQSINRFAEAMTLFAVACAGMFPLLHMGRPWLFFWLLPYPDTMGTWPQFRSPLVWDVFAVSTYATISLLFWFVGLIPDLATLRDRAKNRLPRMIYGFLAMGWRGSAMHWHRYEMAYLLLAGLATPLVVSVHTVVSFDFTVAIVPGWHSTIFPPYFVAGAIYSGFAMVLTLAIPLRKFYGLEDFVTLRHLDNMAKILLATGLIVAYGYMMETFMAFYSGQHLRPLHDHEPDDRPLRSRLLDSDPLQHCDPAHAPCGLRKIRRNVGRAVRDLPGRPDRHVAGALRDRGHQPAPRFHALVVGNVLSDRLGLGDVLGYDRIVLHPVPAVHPLPAHDLDLRDARAGA